MSRFKVSKYRNAFPAVSKKEFWVHDLNVGNDPRPHSSASLIKASNEYVAFISDFRSTGSVSVIPLSSYGRNTSFPYISGHSGMVTDFDFSYFDDNLLSTCGEDGMVKLWNVADKANLASFGPFGSSVESLAFHPQVDNLLAFSEKSSVTVFDVANKNSVYTASLDTSVQAVCWSGDGALIGTVSKADKNKAVRVYDPRQKECVLDSLHHSSLKGSSIVWMGDRKQFITTGYNQSRCAEIALWSLSNASKPIYSSSLGNGSGVPLAMYDEDTCMVYACIKGETTVSFFELQDKDPFLSIGPNVYSGREQVKGICSIPKRTVKVMDCEMARLLLLSQSAILPLSFIVQRKSHAEFHQDLFPDTAGPTPAATVDQWLTGSTAQRVKVSLDPTKQPKRDKPNPKPEKVPEKKETANNSTASSNKTNTAAVAKATDGQAANDKNSDSVTTPSVNVSDAAKKPISFVRSSKVRYIEGKILHKDLSIQHVPKLSTSLSADSNGFTANRERVAFYLFGAGGQIGVYELKDAGRVDANKLLKLENGCNVMDFSFDPFDSRRIAIGLDDSQINIWNIPEDIAQSISPGVLVGHYEKVLALAFHPQAKDVLASSSYDQKIIIWDLATMSSKTVLGPLEESVHSLSWSCNGKYLAALSRDHVIQVFDPRTSTSQIKEGKGPNDSRGGRIIWLNDNYILTTGFNKSHYRIATLFSVTKDTIESLSVLEFENNPSVLVPYYDPDINVVFLTGKGDSAMFTLEFDSSQDPFLFQTATFKCPTAHQGAVFLPKTLCDVAAVQVEYGVRLCTSSVEPFVFTVPRVKKEYFQDDLYPPTLNWWKPALTSSEWFSGTNKQQETTSLCPSGMKPLSEAPQRVAAPKKYESYKKEKTEQEKKDELITAMIGKMGEHEDEGEKLSEEDTAGVDSDEWDD